ncbi:MAG: WYL domain-containing protein [Suipraeoptans sp.]
MKQKDNAKSTLIKYLISNAGIDIPRERIIKEIAISKSRLSELINNLRSDGYNLLTPSRSGIIKLEIGDEIKENISLKQVRQWLIILILSKSKKATYIEIIGSFLSLADSSYLYEKIYIDENYSDMDIIEYLEENNNILLHDINQFFSIPTLRKDLHDLCNHGLIEKNRIPYKDGIHTVYSLTEKSPFILFESEKELFDFINYFDNFKDSLLSSSPLKSVYKKTVEIYDWESYDTATQIYGKANQIDQKQLDALDRLLTHPYKTNTLCIEYNGYNGPISLRINPGLIFYSIETSCFYLLCLNLSETMIAQLRLDRITAIEVTTEKNTYYRTQEIIRIYEEMFSASYSPEVSHVKVLFQNFGNISERVLSLHNKRKNSKMYSLDVPIDGLTHSIVYEDDIRGLSAFSRYIRSFGSSALVIEPIELQNNLIKSFNKILTNYERSSE